MKPVRLLVAVLVAALAFVGLGVSTAGAATTVEQCQSELSQLKADTLASSSSFTNSKSVTSLVGKLDAASAKLSEGKNADAVQKLTDFQTSLNALAAAGKVDATTAQNLNNEAQGVIDCINSIGSTA